MYIYIYVCVYIYTYPIYLASRPVPGCFLVKQLQAQALSPKLEALQEDAAQARSDYPEGPNIQYLRFLVPKPLQLGFLGTRNLKTWGTWTLWSSYLDLPMWTFFWFVITFGRDTWYRAQKGSTLEGYKELHWQIQVLSQPNSCV